MKCTVAQEVTIRRGESATENWALIDAAEGSWVWLHLDSFPSPHVVVESASPSAQVVAAAAEFCRGGSKYRRLGDLKVCYTTVSNLVKGDAPGSVEYRSRRKVKKLKLK